MPLDKKSLAKLVGVHPDLVRVIVRASTMDDAPPFVIVEGLRSTERQAQLLKQHATTTMNSRHITGHAIDFNPLMNGKPTPSHWPLFRKVVESIKKAAALEQVKITCGSDWRKFPDGAHVELDWKAYPLVQPSVKPLTQSKQMIASVTGGTAIPLAGVTDQLAEAQTTFGQYAVYFEWGKWILLALAVASFLVVGYIRYQDSKKGIK